uniref:Putative RecF/RecN/SMC domain contining protein n=3 Tax=viral metagenome TaxID=1070528 RepID=A0A6M3M2W4_9ZZZZ
MMQISKIEMNGFNGINCPHNLGQHTLFLGKRGSGKSSVYKALKFCLSPISSANLPKEFLTHYDTSSQTEKFSVTLTTDDGQVITRELSRSAKNEVKQKFLNGDKALTRNGEANFLQDLGITLPDIDNFLEMSDQKKIEHLFKIFPCEVDVEKLTDQIDRSKEQENELQRKILGKREAIQSLEEQLAAFPVASGATIELLQGEIAKTETTIKDYEQQLREEGWAIQERQRITIAEDEAKRREQVAAEKATEQAQETARLDAQRTEEENRQKIAAVRREEQERARIATLRDNAEKSLREHKGIELSPSEARELQQAENEEVIARVKREGKELWQKEKEIMSGRPEFAFPEETADLEEEVLRWQNDNLNQKKSEWEEANPWKVYPRRKRCKECLTDLSEIIDKADKPMVCYACEVELMPFPGLIDLKMLRRRIEK